MKILNFRDFKTKYNLNDETMNGSELQRVYNYKIHPRDSIKTTDKGFVNIDDGIMGGSHWVCLIVKDNKSFYFDSFGGHPDNLLPNQLPKPIIYHNYKFQDNNSKFCGSYSLYFFYLIERMEYRDTISKMYFG